MKIAVYAICKNESAFVDRWMDSMEEADEVVVLDTGSTDDTVARLTARGAKVTTELIIPWRFDRARNRSLELVPEDTDICICTDLDEIFLPGWREKLENAWKTNPGVTQAAYRYTWSFSEDGSEGVVFWIEKCHARHGYRWVHPVHEVITWVGDGERKQGEKLYIEGMQLNHFPDRQKSRGQYLPLLELSVREDPEDDRNMHYLGREYLYHGQFDDCIKTLERHLALPTARWADERAASMRYIAKAYGEKKDYIAEHSWYLRAVAEAPYLREPYMDLAMALYRTVLREEGTKRMILWQGILYYTTCALAITERPRTYITEAAAWGSLPHDLCALACHYLGQPERALKEARKALEMEPKNERLRGNVEFFEREKE